MGIDPPFRMGTDSGYPEQKSAEAKNLQKLCLGPQHKGGYGCIFEM
jgi:hypothetical protein